MGEHFGGDYIVRQSISPLNFEEVYSNDYINIYKLLNLICPNLIVFDCSMFWFTGNLEFMWKIEYPSALSWSLVKLKEAFYFSNTIFRVLTKPLVCSWYK